MTKFAILFCNFPNYKVRGGAKGTGRVLGNVNLGVSKQEPNTEDGKWDAEVWARRLCKEQGYTLVGIKYRAHGFYGNITYFGITYNSVFPRKNLERVVYPPKAVDQPVE